MLIIKVKFESYKELTTKTNITFSTTEEIDEIQLAQLKRTKGHLAFSADEFKKEVEDAMKDRKLGVDKSGASPSSKIRAEMFQAWTHSEEEIGWEDYYIRETAKIENHYAKKHSR